MTGDDRIKGALRVIGGSHEPDPDWQRRVLLRIARQERSELISEAIITAVALALIGLSLWLTW